MKYYSHNVILITFLFTWLIVACSSPSDENASTIQVNETVNLQSYHTYTSEEEQFTGGIRMIPVNTPSGTFNVWTKRVGNNPEISILLLHGGPGGTHEFFECFDSHLPAEGIEYIYYDQLGSYYSDQPSDTTLWTTERFVEEVEQVRQALGLDKDNFFLLGQSWGGILAMEYALKYQENLKGLIISNMMASVPAYNAYAKEVLGPAMDPAIYQQIVEYEAAEDFANPGYMDLLMQYHYPEHVLRKPLGEWPESINRAFKHLNPEVYIYMQGYSEFGITGDASLKNWDRSADLSKIEVPTLVIGAQHDTMDPDYMKWMSEEIPDASYLYCENGSHLSQYDDQKTYMNGLIDFVKSINNRK
jgi:proline iminopeptidase